MIKSLLTSSFLLLITNSIGRFSIFFISVISARTLEQSEYGRFSLLRMAINSINAVILGSFAASTTKEIAKLQDRFEIQRYLQSVIVVNVFLLLLMLFLLPVIAYTNTGFSIELLFISVFTVCFCNLSILLQSACIGLEAFRTLLICSIVSSSLSLPIIFYLITNYYLSGALLSLAIYYFVEVILRFYWLLKNNYISFFFCKKSFFAQFISMISSNHFLVINTVIINTSFWFVRHQLSSNGGYIELALFDVAFQLLAILMIVTGAITSVSLARISKSIAKKSVAKEFYLNLFVNFLISVVFSSAILIYSDKIVYLFGENYKGSSEVLKIIAFVGVFFSLSTLYNRLFIAANKNRLILKISIVSLICFFVHFFCFSQFEAVGLAFSYLIYYCVTLLLSIISSYRNKLLK